VGDNKDDGLFFGTSPTEKKDLRETPEVKKVDLRSLDFDSLDRSKYDAPEKVGESLRLIDMAMGKEPAPPPKLHFGSPESRRAPRPNTPQATARPGAPKGAPPVRPAPKGPPKQAGSLLRPPPKRPAQPVAGGPRPAPRLAAGTVRAPGSPQRPGATPQRPGAPPARPTQRPGAAPQRPGAAPT